MLRADWADKPFGKRTSGQGSCQVQGWLLRRDEGTITEILQPQTHHTQLTFISCPAPTHFPGNGSCWFCLNLCALLFGFSQIKPFCPITIKIHRESHQRHYFCLIHVQWAGEWLKNFARCREDQQWRSFKPSVGVCSGWEAFCEINGLPSWCSKYTRGEKKDGAGGCGGGGGCGMGGSEVAMTIPAISSFCRRQCEYVWNSTADADSEQPLVCFLVQNSQICYSPHLTNCLMV